MEKDINKLAQEVNLKISETKAVFLIKSEFKLESKSNLGIVLLLLISVGCLSMFIQSAIEDSESLPIIFSILILLLIIGLTLGIISQATDSLEVNKENVLTTRMLRKKKFILNSSLELSMKSECRQGKPKKYRSIDIILINDDKENNLLHFEMREKNRAEAEKLGSAIIKKIKERIDASNSREH